MSSIHEAIPDEGGDIFQP